MTKHIFSSVEIDALPTILDVVEQISAIENKLALPNVSQIPSPEFLDEGRYSFVSDRNNRSIARLMPMSQSPFRYYRGQSRYHSPCQPTLYRKKKDGTYPTKEEKGARLGYALISNHAFVDGNKRIGTYIMLTFLEMNGIRIQCTDEELVHIGLSVADGSMKYEELLQWVLDHE